ncbi:unnamed protein product [Arabis nemorensis]|uniref:Protein LOW PSII ACCUMULATION 2, chloroplastic n=1 Tax=Arabis nemorensis TaxID=586526 RepID=A0A565CE62_9BRAS|nr:unnamed protein product [Arabis nemorensis]
MTGDAIAEEKNEVKMAVQINSSCALSARPYHHLLASSRNRRFAIKCQIETEDPGKPRSSGVGFGSAAKGKGKGKREVIRRSPVEKPVFVSSEEGAAKAEELRRNENAFLLTWLALGALILIQGILLAASGFLPEELDKLFVKYVYPVFTPSVGLFVAGTTAYGVLKYIQNEKLKDQN